MKDPSLSELLKTFLVARELDAPDGRPLYAYRCTPREAALLQVELRAAFSSRASSIGPLTAQAFCLWAAAYWHRQYRGGGWSWSELLSAVGAEHLSPSEAGYPALCRMVVEGLQRWKRPVLRGANSRLFLVTLACEGGLPLHLVTREQARLRTYFRELFEEFRLHELTGALRNTSAQDLARQVGWYLPVSLRHDVVFELSGQLVNEVWRLLEHARHATDPVAALDQRCPGWRQRLPVDLADNVAAAFLNGLVTEATVVARAEGTAIRWGRALAARAPVHDGSIPEATPAQAEVPCWDLLGRLQLPATLRIEQVKAALPGETIPARFDLCVRTGTGEIEVAAIGITREREAVVSLERARRALAPVRGARAAEGRAVVIRGDRGALPPWSDFRGALPLSPLPWVFVPAAAPDGVEHAFAGEGSVRVQATEALVAVTGDYRPVPRAGASYEEAGSIHELRERLVYRVRGSVDFIDGSGSRCVVSTSVAGADGVDYRLSGPRSELSRIDIPAFLGLPTVTAARERGMSTRIQSHELRWRSSLQSGRIDLNAANGVGEGLLSHLVNGEVRFAARICLLPPKFEVHLTAIGDVEGLVELKEIANADVGIESAGVGLVACDRPARNTVRLRVRAVGAAPATLTLRLLWPGCGTACVDLPFPARQVGFFTANGQRLPTEASIAMSQLGAVRATALVPNRGHEFHVEGTYHGRFNDEDAVAVNRLILRQMVEGLGGACSLDLMSMQHDVAIQLNARDELDGKVRLRIRSDDDPNLPSATLDVTRYDLRLERHDGGATLRLDTDTLARLSPPEVEALRLEAFPLLDPGADTVALARTGSAAWLAPGIGCTSGPWLVLGWHGRWCRVRPMLCDVPGEIVEAPEGGLRWACLQPTETRATAIEVALRAMASNPDHPDWPLLAGFVRWTADLPTTTFDALRVLGRMPGAIATAAFRVPELDPDLDLVFWRALQVLPFTPFSLTRSAWHDAMAGWLKARVAALLSTGLGAMVPDWNPIDLIERDLYGPAARRLIEDVRMPWLEPVLDQARHDALGTDLMPQTRAISQPAMQNLLLGQYRDVLGRAPTIAFNCGLLPRASEIMAHVSAVNTGTALGQLLVAARDKYEDPARHAFVNAPAVAAVCSVMDVDLSQAAQIQLRNVHDRDPQWFRDAYRAAFLFALGSVTPGAPSAS